MSERPQPFSRGLSSRSTQLGLSKRAWFYLVSLLVVIVLIGFLYNTRTKQQQELNSLVVSGQQQEKTNMHQYLNRQTDARKIVSLAKYVSKEHPYLVQSILEKAYELNPNSRDIAVLLSSYRPELKKRVIELDPLYKFDN